MDEYEVQELWRDC